MIISVIIPTCHRNDLLARCLDCLAPGVQSLGADRYEVIVTDDGHLSTSSELLLRQYPWARWVAGPRQGPAANRNNGAKHASGRWLAFVDDDCLPGRDWLAAIWADALTGAYDVIEGKTVTPDKVDNPFRQGVENLNGNCYWSCNLAVCSEVFFSIGAFDEDFLEAGGEDMEFAYRIRTHHLRACFEEKALVLHPTRLLGWKQLIWRTRLDRWMLLYRIKTGAALPSTASSGNVVLSLFASQIVGLLGMTYHLFAKPDHKSWRTRLFFSLWKWLTFPALFPYLVKWEFKFRTQNCSRQGLR